jgi:hypothetical protein
MKKTLALSFCLVLAIIMASIVSAYLPTGETSHQTALRQNPANLHDKTPSPGDADKRLYVPSCVIDSSLSGKPPMDKRSEGDVTDKSGPGVPPAEVEIGSFRCQT